MDIALAGDFAASYTDGDNSLVIATDTMKNTVYAFAPEHLTGAIEAFALVLARHFLDSPQVASASVNIAEHGWERLSGATGPAPDAFRRTGGATRTASVVATASGVVVESGVTDLVVMKTAKSAFTGFPRDRYTTLGETGDRIMATKVTATWRHGGSTADWDTSHAGVLATMLETFADHDSESVQHSIWILGKAMLERHTEIDEVRMSPAQPASLDRRPHAVRRHQPRRDLRRDAGPARPHRGDGPSRDARPVSTGAQGVEVVGAPVPGLDRVLMPEALAFLADLQRRFGPEREALLRRRAERHARISAGERPDFLAETAEIRAADWRVAPAPPDLDDRRVEITGPAETKMMINALNSGARVFMADLEDALSPTWANVVGGQVAIADAVRRTLVLDTADKSYRLNDATATLVVRPRGWHLEERHVLVDGRPMSASLFDAGLFLFHDAAEALSRGSGPYLYLPKLESHLEARLWNDVFVHAQAAVGVPRGSIRATVLIETILAAFEMDEILYELREHAAGLNAGRWDYIFTLIKRFRDDPAMVLPDRGQVTMAVPFMRAYTRLLVATCHRRGAHAIGGMSAFIPNRREPEVTANALAKVRDDKDRELGDGFDGTWVAHPDLVPVAMAEFDRVLGNRPNQKTAPGDPAVPASALLDIVVPGGRATEAGARQDVSVTLRYLDAWLRGNGAAAIDNLMEDAATAEISRSQLWQWRRHGTALDDGRPFDDARYALIRDQELDRIGRDTGRVAEAAALLDGLVLTDDFPEFLTLEAYRRLD